MGAGTLCPGGLAPIFSLHVFSFALALYTTWVLQCGADTQYVAKSSRPGHVAAARWISVQLTYVWNCHDIAVAEFESLDFQMSSSLQ